MSALDRELQPSDQQEAAEEQELLELEEQVQQMAQKILDYRCTIPDQLSSTLAFLLASQRPVLPTQRPVLPTHLVEKVSELETWTDALPECEAGTSRDITQQRSNNQEDTEKVQLLKQKISSNTCALPVVLKRMKEFMSRMDKFESSYGTIHPAFKRRWNN